MAINEAYNVDCIEYMRTLPDNCFDLAVCDPPYGSGNNPKLGGQNGSENDSGDTSSRNRFQGGTWATRYRVPMGGVLN